MGSNDPGLKEYIRSISCELPCSGKKKKQIISQIRSGIMDYLQENPEADISAIQAHFGTGREIAAGFVDYEDASVLLKKMSIKKKALAIIAGVMILITVTWGAVVAWSMYKAQTSTDRIITDEIRVD